MKARRSSNVRFATSCRIVSRQLNLLLLRLTNAPEASTINHTNGKDDAAPSREDGEDKPASVDDEDGCGGGGGDGAGKAEDTEKDTAMLVAAGLKVVRTVCTKAENNKGETCEDR